MLPLNIKVANTLNQFLTSEESLNSKYNLNEIFGNVN